jgi:hypothetical protein
MPRKGPEAKLLKEILKYLKSLGPDVYALKIHGGGWGRTGIPDLWIIARGKLFVFELKSPGEKLTPKQAREAARINRAGCDVHVVDSYEQFLECFFVPDAE